MYVVFNVVSDFDGPDGLGPTESWRKLYEWMKGQMELSTLIPQLINAHESKFTQRPRTLTYKSKVCWEFTHLSDLEYFLLCLPPTVGYEIIE